MTLDSSLDAVTQALLAARRGPDAAPDDTLAGALPDAAAAYAVQRRCAAALGWFGATPPLHWKSGGPSLETPLTHAALPPAGVWASPAQAGPWPFRQRLVESEIALRLGRPVDAALAATLDVDSARGLVDAMAVSIELVDSRWRQGLAAPALLRLADLASHAALVLGAWVPFVARDWSTQRCRLHIGTQPVVEREGSHSLGDPCFVLPQWLRHATAEHGVLPAGTVVTTGTWAGAPPAQAGDRVTVAFDGIGQATVQL
jgi:2-keto-4-pentenoate hydratase